APRQPIASGSNLAGCPGAIPPAVARPFLECCRRPANSCCVTNEPSPSQARSCRADMLQSVTPGRVSSRCGRSVANEETSPPRLAHSRAVSVRPRLLAPDGRLPTHFRQFPSSALLGRRSRWCPQSTPIRGPPPTTLLVSVHPGTLQGR